MYTCFSEGIFTAYFAYGDSCLEWFLSGVGGRVIHCDLISGGTCVCQMRSESTAPTFSENSIRQGETPDLACRT